MSEKRHEEGKAARTTYVVFVCPDCREQILSEPEYDKRRGEYVRGHYHDPPVDWEGPEDPWFDAVEIHTVEREAA